MRTPLDVNHSRLYVSRIADPFAAIWPSDGQAPASQSRSDMLGGVPPRNHMTICSVAECDRPLISVGLCAMHYSRRRRGTDPSAPPRSTKGVAEKYYRDVVLAYDGTECLNWPFWRGGKGYGRMWLNGTKHNVHRLVCEAIHGAPPTSEHQAAHSCGNGHLGCVAKNHLSWKTPLENAADRHVHGRYIKSVGYRRGVSKLTEADVDNIRRMRKTMSGSAIARLFSVDKSTINRINRGAAWRWMAAVTS